jgi:hypothetical protein
VGLFQRAYIEKQAKDKLDLTYEAYDPDQEKVEKMKEIESAAVGLAELQEE